MKVIKKLYWLGFIGLIGTFTHIRFLEYFYLFFILGIVDLILSLAIITKYENDNDNKDIINLKFLFQNLGMLFGIPIIYIKNLFRLPNVKSYKPEVLYSLPFEGRWLVVNGGNTSEPHIHFQVQQGKSFLMSASLPISFIDIKYIPYQGERQFISRGQFVEN